jgi:hypothetical protein
MLEYSWADIDHDMEAHWAIPPHWNVDPITAPDTTEWSVKE